jgi:Ca2+ transporting ATPase
MGLIMYIFALAVACVAHVSYGWHPHTFSAKSTAAADWIEPHKAVALDPEGNPLSQIAMLLLAVSQRPLGLSRRAAVGSAAGLLSAAVIPPRIAFAKQDDTDLTRLRKGLTDVQYLLDNWATETVDPNSGDDKPDIVRRYVGLRTTDHPLFQIDKLLTTTLKNGLPDEVDPEDWVAKVEGLESSLAKINELAYTSSFGEYNPGGGKGQVRKYLDLTKEQVFVAKDCLTYFCKTLGV